MHGVTVTAERVDLQAVFFKSRFEFLEVLFVCEKNRGIAVSLSGLTTRADLQFLNAEGFKISECFIKRSVAEKYGYYA